MHIALKTRFLNNNTTNIFNNYVVRLFIQLAETHKQHHFYIIVNRPLPGIVNFPENVIKEVVAVKEDGIFLMRILTGRKVARVLRRIKADIVINADGFCNTVTRLPQIMMLHDVSYLHFAGMMGRIQQLFYKLHFPKCLQKSTLTIVSSTHLQDVVATKYKIPEEKLHVVEAGVSSDFVVLDWEDREQVKEEFAEGCEYFVFTGGFEPQQNLLNVLKAFSIFKKRQQTNMKLLVLGNLQYKSSENLELIESYKFRKGIKLLGDVTEGNYKRVVAGAYALLYPVLHDELGLPVLQAMKSEVAVITSDYESLQVIAMDAALYVDAHDPTSIAEQMKIIYKDENTRARLIKKGNTIASQQTLEGAAVRLWTSIEAIVSQ